MKSPAGAADTSGLQSILTCRMRTSNPATMMPELGRTLVHTEGFQLISA